MREARSSSGTGCVFMEQTGLEGNCISNFYFVNTRDEPLTSKARNALMIHSL